MLVNRNRAIKTDHLDWGIEPREISRLKLYQEPTYINRTSIGTTFIEWKTDLISTVASGKWVDQTIRNNVIKNPISRRNRNMKHVIFGIGNFDVRNRDGGEES